MTGIELPVRVEELRGGNVRLVDAKGETLRPYDIVAILNASPPRAFSSLTLAEFHRIIAEDIADPESMVGDARTLLRRLQAFAAPTPAELDPWQPIETAPKDGSPFIGFTKTRFGRIIAIWSWQKESENKKPNPYFARDGFYGKTDDRANQPTHWMPLPAAPEGGAA